MDFQTWPSFSQYHEKILLPQSLRFFLDGFIRRCLKAALRKQKKQPSSGKIDRDHKPFGKIFAANDWTMILPSWTTKVSVTMS